MSIRRWVAVVATACFAILVAEAIAHHASAPFYDPENRVEFEGIVTRWVFRNPHAFLFLNVLAVSYTHLTLPTILLV